MKIKTAPYPRRLPAHRVQLRRFHRRQASRDVRPQNSRCDGNVDCPSGKDEAECSLLTLGVHGRKVRARQARQAPQRRAQVPKLSSCHPHHDVPCAFRPSPCRISPASSTATFGASGTRCAARLATASGRCRLAAMSYLPTSGQREANKRLVSLLPRIKGCQAGPRVESHALFVVLETPSMGGVTWQIV